MKEELKKCLDVLRKGGTILYPTDTVWGIGCDATNEQAVRKVFGIKCRQASKSMLLLLAEANQISSYADYPAVALNLVEYAKHPLTIIYPNAHGIASSLIAEDGSIGIRVVKDDFCKQLIAMLRKPIVSTSANISGEPTPCCFSEISNIIKESVDYVVNLMQQEVNKNSPSRILKISLNGTIEMIRP